MTSPAVVHATTAAVLHAPRVPVVRGVGETVTGDYRRVVLKRFFPSTTKIAERIARHVLELEEKAVTDILQATISRFRERHFGLEDLFCDRATEVVNTLNKEPKMPEDVKKMAMEATGARRALLGSVFLHEYAVEAAALFNPSIVPHPEQPEAAGNSRSRRVVISLRSCGEGHISSISFREATLTEDGRIVLDDNVTKNLSTGKIKVATKEGCDACEVCETYRNPVTGHEFAVKCGPYQVDFNDSTPISGRVLFPQTPEQCNGIEDARFVRFVDTDGQAMYYATLTAYDGKSILPQLIETPDFKSFKYHCITGQIANKGMALFPRKINGLYYTLSRQDDESIMLMKSDNILHWGNPQKLVEPKYAWEWFKMGNCGSPVETSFGWLVLTHGVGPLRRYSIGIVVLDLHDPSKVIGRLASPVIEPTENEREGYVPNVVYTCGAMVHNDELMIPYAISDSRTTFATIHLNDIAAAAGLTTSKL